MKIRVKDVGKQCLVKWDDVGEVEGIIIERYDETRTRVYEFVSKTHRLVENSQVVSIGAFVKPRPVPTWDDRHVVVVDGLPRRHEQLTKKQLIEFIKSKYKR